MALGDFEGLDQVLRHDGVADADVGQHHLGECADVEDAGLAVEALQGRDRPSVVVELTVVVVLDQRRAGGLGEAEQFQPAVDRHQLARRVLMRRRDEDEPRPVPATGQRQAAAVDGHADHIGAGGFERHAGADVAGAFQPRDVARIQQHAGNQLDRRLAEGVRMIWRGFVLTPRCSMRCRARASCKARRLCPPVVADGRCAPLGAGSVPRCRAERLGHRPSPV